MKATDEEAGGKTGGRKPGVTRGRLKLKNVRKERERQEKKMKKAAAAEEKLDERVKKKSDRYCKQT